MVFHIDMQLKKYGLIHLYKSIPYCIDTFSNIKINRARICGLKQFDLMRGMIANMQKDVQYLVLKWSEPKLGQYNTFKILCDVSFHQDNYDEN